MILKLKICVPMSTVFRSGLFVAQFVQSIRSHFNSINNIKLISTLPLTYQPEPKYWSGYHKGLRLMLFSCQSELAVYSPEGATMNKPADANSTVGNWHTDFTFK